MTQSSCGMWGLVGMWGLEQGPAAKQQNRRLAIPPLFTFLPQPSHPSTLPSSYHSYITPRAELSITIERSTSFRSTSALLRSAVMQLSFGALTAASSA